jgi:hypothetical protein
MPDIRKNQKIKRKSDHTLMVRRNLRDGRAHKSWDGSAVNRRAQVPCCRRRRHQLAGRALVQLRHVRNHLPTIT